MSHSTTHCRRMSDGAPDEIKLMHKTEQKCGQSKQILCFSEAHLKLFLS